MIRQKLSKTETRRGEPPGVMRYVMVLSTTVALTALVVVSLVGF